MRSGHGGPCGQSWRRYTTATASAIALMCAGVEPQQPPSTLTWPASAHSLTSPAVVTGASMIVTRGQTVTLTEADILATDPDNAALTYTVSGVTGAYFQLSSAAGTPITTFTTAQLEIELKW